MFFKKQPEPLEEISTKPVEDSQLEKLRKRIEEAELPPHAHDAAIKELEKLEKTDAAVAEYSVGMNYVDLLVSLPWNTTSKGTLELARARAVLEERHCGLEQVKQRILEFLAAKTLRQKARQSILIVDDEEIARANMEYVLTKDGYHCHCAANGVAALDILAQEEIDLIVSDLKMERMDGMELLSTVNRTHPEIPVIMVTGFASVNSAVEAMRSGAAYYLGKPVNLDELKKTVREVLERTLTADMGKSPILCFTGPPGTGKTSVGRAIAEALQLNFIRVSLAGLRDEAELRGHRRTYVGAMPGRIITELKRSGVNNPVFMLDEIDKIGQDFRGDPASVMLEVLDPEQNVRFMDHYLDIPFNLSRIMFIATANDVGKLPAPLLDRMELIEFTGYTEKEKCRIAEKFIIPRQLKASGLRNTGIEFSQTAIARIISGYTRESGLRNLEREIANVCRKLALARLDKEDEPVTTILEPDMIAAFLGPRRFIRDGAIGQPRIGITTGLVWSEAGGEIISVETVAMKGNGRLLLTGSLGEVLQESAQAALSLIRSRAGEYGISDHYFAETDIHIHFPAGGIAKDGPSAGITIFAALVSLLTKRPARRDVAMTGEMTLSGRILPISGIREKLLAAQRTGMQRVILPLANKDEVEILPADVKEGFAITLVESSDEVLPYVLVDNPGKEQY